MSAKIQTFEQNAVGRDFVVGDIHGCFPMLTDKLKTIAFNEETDRLFSVGDLVDRGPFSAECLEWLNKPFFHAVRGNHEQMAIDYQTNGWPRDNYISNGGRWFVETPSDQVKHFLETFNAMPIIIEVDIGDAFIGIVHAEPSCYDWQQFKAQIESCDERATMMALWGRTRIERKDVTEVSGIEAVIVGHTPVEAELYLGNVVYIDTGAVFGRQITVVQIGEPKTT